MLELIVDSPEFWDEEKEELVSYPPATLHLEHSLLSCSKWEAIFKKPFLSDRRMESREENLAYINCMSLDGPIDPGVLSRIGPKQWKQIEEYIGDPQTATKISSTGGKTGRKRVITSELIYYWMIAQNIPKEFETWPLGRLLTLIEVVSIESNPKKKKMASRDVTKMYHELNAKRLAESGGSG